MACKAWCLSPQPRPSCAVVGMLSWIELCRDLRVLAKLCGHAWLWGMLFQHQGEI